MDIKLILSDITSSAGTERATINLANNLSKHGHSVTIFSLYTTTGNPYFNVAENIEIKHLKIKTSKYLIIRVLFGFFKTFLAVYNNLANNKSVIIGTNHVHNFIIAIIKTFKPSNKYIGCEHLSYTALTVYSKFLVKHVYKYLDVAVVLTDNDKAHFNRDVPSVLCETIPNQLSFYPSTVSTCDNKNLLAIGRYTYQKGFDLLIDLLAGPLTKFPDWTLRIVGDGEMKDALKAKIDNYKLSNNIILVSSTKNVADLFLDSSIYLMTSRYEGLPMVLLEAKACGLPIISYDCPTGPSVLIKENDGILVPMDDSEYFVKSLMYLIENTEKRKQLGKNARVNSLDYSAEIIYNKWESLLNRL